MRTTLHSRKTLDIEKVGSQCIFLTWVRGVSGSDFCLDTTITKHLRGFPQSMHSNTRNRFISGPLKYTERDYLISFNAK